MSASRDERPTNPQLDRGFKKSAPGLDPRENDERYLIAALAIIVAFMAVEVVVAIMARSLVLLADAGHMLIDAAAVALSVMAIRLARRPATPQWTFGLKRAEVVSAAINGLTLIVVACLIAAEAIRRLLHPPKVAGLPIILVAAVGIGMNLLVTLLVSKADQENLSVAGAFAHLLTDLWAYIATFGAGIAIIVSGYSRSDAIASLLVAALMMKTAWALLRDSGRILFEAAPIGMDLAEVRAHLLATEHVQDVHDLHAWVVTSDLPALSAHIVIDDSCFQDGRAPQVLRTLQRCLIDHFDLEHSTFQLESSSHAVQEGTSH